MSDRLRRQPEFTAMNTKKALLYAFLVCLSLVTLTGCETKFTKMSDEELEEKYQECQMVKNPQPGTAIACGNIEKEYKRRNG